MIRAIKGGCDTRHPRTFLLTRPNGLPNHVVLIIRSAGEFQIGSEHFTVTPPQAVILAPHTSYRYGNPDGIYMDDWLHFETTDEACTRRLNAMSNRPFPIGNHRLCTFCIQQILWEQSYGDPAAAQENTDALFVLLLNHLNEAFRKQAVRQARNPFQERLQLLRLEMENTSQEPHTAAELAQRLNISESYFESLYKKLFGISFRQDVIRMRVERAKFLVTTTDLPLEQVAEICGYANEVHFYRQFKKLTGTSPGKFRRQGNPSEWQIQFAPSADKR